MNIILDMRVRIMISYKRDSFEQRHMKAIDKNIMSGFILRENPY